MGRVAAAGGRQHGSGETEEAAMIEEKQGLSPPLPAGCYIGVHITRPDSELPDCKAWPALCVLEAYLDDRPVDMKLLPVARGDADAEKDEVNAWGMFLVIPVGSDWRSKSLELLVRRLDSVPVQGDGDRRLLIRGGPHTSFCDVVVGVARLSLAGALLPGDDDEGEEREEDRKKRRRDEATPEGTLEFRETVTLVNWDVTAPPLGTPGSALRLLVSRGRVNVRMGMFRV